MQCIRGRPAPLHIYAVGNLGLWIVNLGLTYICLIFGLRCSTDIYVFFFVSIKCIRGKPAPLYIYAVDNLEL